MHKPHERHLSGDCPHKTRDEKPCVVRCHHGQGAHGHEAREPKGTPEDKSAASSASPIHTGTKKEVKKEAKHEAQGKAAPNSSEAPKTSEVPKSKGVPKSSESPKPSEMPKSSEEPKSSEVPKASEVPGASRVGSATRTPVADTPPAASPEIEPASPSATGVVFGAQSDEQLPLKEEKKAKKHTFF